MTKSHQDQVYFRPRNWERFQGYTKRGPVWIKLHLSILESPEIGDLSDTHFRILVTLWCLYARTGAALPAHRRYMERHLGKRWSVIRAALVQLEALNLLEKVPKPVALPATKVSHQTEIEKEIEKDSLATLGTSPVGDPSGKEFDPAKQLFDFGVQLLASYGISRKKAGALIGKWRKVRKDPDLMAILLRAGETRRFEIVPFIEGSLRDQVQRPRSWVEREREASAERMAWIRKEAGVDGPGEISDDPEALHSVSGGALDTDEAGALPPDCERLRGADRQRISGPLGRGSGDSDAGIPGDLAEGHLANGRTVHPGADGQHAQAANGSDRSKTQAGPRKARCSPPALGPGPASDPGGHSELALGLGDEEP